jgi:hypothetical protein
MKRALEMEKTKHDYEIKTLGHEIQMNNATHEIQMNNATHALAIMAKELEIEKMRNMMLMEKNRAYDSVNRPNTL